MAISLLPRPFISLRTSQSFNLSPRVFSLRLSCSSSSDGSAGNQQVSSNPEKRSFAAATGDMFIGVASRLLKRSNQRTPPIIEDEVDPEMIWEQRVKDVEAEKERRVITSPGFSFSAAGLLFPYHLGVAQLLIEKGYIKDTTPLAGASAGAVVCAVITSGSSMWEALEATKVLADDCRRNGTAFRLGAVLRESMEKLLPDDIHIRSNGRVRVAVTQVLWKPRGLLVDQFDSKSDLINAVHTSSFIPGYLAPRPVTMFRNRVCVDGGLTLFMPPTAAAKTVRVCAFSASSFKLKGIGISPDCNPLNRATARQLLKWALEPAEDEVLDRLFELGYADAATWSEMNPVDELVYDDTPAAQAIQATTTNKQTLVTPQSFGTWRFVATTLFVKVKESNRFLEYQQHTRPSIDNEDSTSIDRHPEFEKRAYDCDGSRKFHKDDHGHV
ncbi:BnaA08g06610D [Brassica napus]|uniref:Patatin n=1 Tax=Brassica napus TaxID=3708 RepID=A0A078I505_BRANA|nr:BnaA08g06610D [Brassica napus]